MRMKGLYIVLGLLMVLLVSLTAACGNSEAVKKEDTEEVLAVSQSEEKNELYENALFNLKVQYSTGWQLNQEVKKVKNDKLIVTFKNNNKVNAIITSVATKKSFTEIKDELKNGAGTIEVLENKGNQLSYKSTLENNIRTDNYLEKHGDYTYVYTFMTPNKDYQQVKHYIADFRKNIKLN